MKVVVDMCLSPLLATELTNAGFHTVHWSSVGDPLALDAEIMAWAAINDHILITHDLDFVDLLFLTSNSKPSVIVLRIAKTTTANVLPCILRVLNAHGPELANGTLVSMTSSLARFRKLPLSGSA